MTYEELKGAWNFGMAAVEEYKNICEPIPTFITERLIEIGNELIKIIEGGLTNGTGIQGRSQNGET